MDRVKVIVAEKVVEANDRIAERNRRLFREKDLVVTNLIGAPGCGKTTLLEKTLQRLATQLRIAVVEGDIFTARDAERIARMGVQVAQLNTRGACHMDAGMLEQVLHQMNLENLDLLIVENVGNLVCPAEFDLGEHAKVALLSAAEGSDKPAKYPLVFSEASAVVLTKMDLAGHCDFDLDEVTGLISGLNSDAPVFVTSAVSGEGVDGWCAWLTGLLGEMT